MAPNYTPAPGPDDRDVSPLDAPVSRRGFLRGLSGAFGFLAAASVVPFSGCKEQPLLPPPPALPEHPVEDFDLVEIKRQIVAKYPELQRKSKDTEPPSFKFREMGQTQNNGLSSDYENDPLVEAYFLKASFEDLLADGVMHKDDEILASGYLDQEKVWARKLKTVRSKNSAHVEDIEEMRDNCAALPDQQVTYQGLWEIAHKAVERVRVQKDALGLGSYFDDVIDANLLVGIAIHEIIPAPQKSALLGKYKGYNTIARLAIMRVMLEKGFQINKMPAIHDSVASFGPMQMSVMPYEGRAANEPHHVMVGKGKAKHEVENDGKIPGDIERYLDDFSLPKHLFECVELEDQFVAGLLLLLKRMQQYFNDRLLGNDRFMDLWHAASDVERRKFIATLLGTAHNLPLTAVRALDQAITWSRTDSADYFVDSNETTKDEVKTLSDLTIAYMRIAWGANETAGRHGGCTGTIVERFSRYTMDSTQVASQEPVAVKQPSFTAPAKPSLSGAHVVRLFVRKSVDTEEPYVTFVLAQSIEETVGVLCDCKDEVARTAMTTRIKAFNKTDRFRPGDLLLFPLADLRPDLEDPTLVAVPIPEGSRVEFIQSLFRNPADAPLALVYNGRSVNPPQTLNDLSGVLYLPVEVLK